MGNDKNPRKKKTFRHSTTFYRKVKLGLMEGSMKNYYNVVNKSTLTSAIKSVDKRADKKDLPLDVPIILTDSIEYDDGTHRENDRDDMGSTADGEHNNDNVYIPAEDYVDISEEENIVSHISIAEQLVTWYHAHNLTHSALDDLLRVLKMNGILDLPLDSRTLLKTPQSVNIVKMGNGQFWYNGIENCLTTLNLSNSIRSLSLIFNVDGLPPFRGSPTEFWPILFRIENMSHLQPMVVAIYCGETKPPLEEFLALFIQELNGILKTGVIINNQKIDVKIKYFVCDTPARSFIKGTVGFNAAHGCIKCTVIGEYDKGGRHMSFPRIDCPLRTDESFRNKTDDDHHKVDTPLLKLPINMVEDIIVADSLHLFDLGIMRKCLYGWVNGSYNFRTKLSATQIYQLSDMLEDCNTRKPVEIHRAIRRLKCLKFWKGSEYRTFLLYIGPVVLKDFLSEEAYHNFLTLFCGVTIISCNTYLKYIDVAECLMRDFIEQFIDIYGEDAISSNVHNVCHVVNDVKKFGPLSEISSYPFENFLGHLKGLLHTGNRPLPQLAKRVIELSKFQSLNNEQSLSTSPFVEKENKYENHQLTGCSRVFNKVCIRSDFVLSSDNKNKWFMTKKNNIVSMINSTYCQGNICIYGSAVKMKFDFFEKPLRSSHLNIYKSDGKLVAPKLYSLNEIKCKLVSLKYKDDFVFIPLIHTLDIKIP